MLIKINNGTASEPGIYTVKLDFRFIIYTKANGDEAKIDVEHVSSPESTIVYASTLRRWESHEKKEVTSTEKEIIKNQVDEALTFLNIAHTIV